MITEDLFIKVNTDLLKSLEKSNKMLEQQTDLLIKNQKQFVNIDKSGEKILDAHNDIEKSTKKWGSSLDIVYGGFKKIRDVALSMLAPFTLIFSISNIVNTVKNTADMYSEMKKLSLQMGLGAGNAKSLSNAIFDVSISTGAASQQVKEVVAGLIGLRVAVKDINDLAKATINFAEATGVSHNAATQLTAELGRVGRMGKKEVEGVLLTMGKMQRLVGFNAGEMESLAETTIKTTKILNQMGKSQSQIEKFAKGTALLAGAFSKVGLAASDALKIVEDLLDPSRVEDNAFLLSKLGVSLDDAFNGEVDPGKLAAGFADIGKELKNMSGPAAAEMAKSMGLTLEQARQMADIDIGAFTAALSDTGGDAGAALANMRKETEGGLDGFTKGLEKIKSVLGKLLLPLIPFIEQLGDKFNNGFLNPDKIQAFVKNVQNIGKKAIEFTKGLGVFFAEMKARLPMIIIGLLVGLGLAVLTFKKKFYETSSSISKNLENGISDAIAMGTAKGNARALVQTAEGTKKWKEDRIKRVEETYAFQRQQAIGETTEAMAANNKYFKNVMMWSAKVSKEAGYGVRAASYWTQVEQSLMERARERVKIRELEGKQVRMAYDQQADLVKEQMKEVAIKKNLFQSDADRYRAAQKALMENKNLSDAERKSYQDTIALTSAGYQSYLKYVGELKNLGQDYNKVNQEGNKIEEERKAQALALYKTRMGDRDIAADIVKNNEQAAILEKQRSQNLEEMSKAQEATAVATTALNQAKFQAEELMLNAQREGRALTQAEYLQQQELLKIADSLQVQVDEKLEREKELAKINENFATEQQKVVDKNKDMMDILKERGILEHDLLNMTKAQYEEYVKGTDQAKINLDLQEALQKKMLPPENAIQRFGSALATMGRNLRGNMLEGAQNIKNSVLAAGKSLLQNAKDSGKWLKQQGGGGPLGMLKGLFTSLTTKTVKDKDGNEKREKNTLGKMLGPIGLALGFITGILMKNADFQKAMKLIMDKLKEPINKLAQKIIPIMAGLMPVFEVMADLMTTLVGVVFETVIMPLLKLVLPKVLWLLGAILVAIGKTVEGIGWLVNFFTKNDTLMNAGKNISDAGFALMKTASELNFDSAKLDEIGDNTAATAEGVNDSAPIINMAEAVSGKAANAVSAPALTEAEKQANRQAEENRKIQEENNRLMREQNELLRDLKQSSEVSANAAVQANAGTFVGGKTSIAGAALAAARGGNQ